MLHRMLEGSPPRYGADLPSCARPAGKRGLPNRLHPSPTGSGG